MSDQRLTLEDPWAWVGRDDPAPPDVSDARVIVVIPDGVVRSATPDPERHPGLERTLAAVAALTVQPVRVVVGGETVPATGLAEVWAAVDRPDAGSPGTEYAAAHRAGTAGLDADYCWVVPPGAEFAPDTLERLLRALTGPGVVAAGPVVERTVSRRSDPMIAWVGATITAIGAPVSQDDTGEVNQGQVEDRQVLGLPATGLLVRAATLRAAGGFAASAIPGVELGAIETLRGNRVVVAGDASVVVVGPGGGTALAARRAGMNLASALSRTGALHALGTVLMTLVSVVGHLLVRDPQESSVALRALGGWFTDGAERKRIRTAVRAVPQPDRGTVAGLRPGAGQRFVGWGEQVLGRLGDWVDGFSVRVDSGSVIDDLTGSEPTTDAAARWRLSPAVVGVVALLVLGGISLAQLFRAGFIVGEQLLPAPSWALLWESYLGPVAGQPPGSGAPWLALVGLWSLLFFGNVDLSILVALILVVPATWLAAYRLLRQVLSMQARAVLAATAIALSPVLVGATNRGALGTSIGLLFVILAVQAARMTLVDGSWRWVATLAVCLTVVAAIQPLLWFVAVALLAWGVVARRIGWVRALVAALGPVVWLAPWIPALWRWPGRLLTGPDPVLAPQGSPSVWGLIIGRDAGAGLPPVWLSAVVLGALWVIALAALARAGRRAWPSWGVAVGGLAVAVVLGKLSVAVPAADGVRPDVTLWLAVFVSGLALAGAVGGDGVLTELRGASLGWRQVVVGALSLLSAGALVLAGGWWVLGGAKELHRDDLSSIPPFVAKAQTSDTPGRTLVIRVQDGHTGWALLEDDLPRLGDAERGVSAGGSSAAEEATAAVVSRLLAGTADNALEDDLRALGVTYLWVVGAGQDTLSGIGNTPGLGIGSGEEGLWVWPVPDSGRVLVVDGDETTPVGHLATITAGSNQRILILSEPADPRWEATLDGHALQPLGTTDWRQRFELGSSGGTLDYRLKSDPWWAWGQLAILAFALVMIAPSRAPGSQSGTRGALS